MEKKRAVPMQQWETTRDYDVKKDSRKVIGVDFDPMCSKERVVTYVKVNEQDH